MDVPPSPQDARAYKNELLLKMLERSKTPVAFAQDAAPSEITATALRALPPDIQGVGFGLKTIDGGGVSSQEAVRIYVRNKQPRSAIPTEELIPASVNGIPTDVVVVGDIMARARPTRCGVSIGHAGVTAGTLGCLVRVGKDKGVTYILSNNHVLANVNEAEVGDPILQPGPLDGGNPDDPIAELYDFEPIRFAGHNHIDAAIARLLEPESVLPEITVIGRAEYPAMDHSLYQSVRKHGRTTAHTLGVVVDTDADIYVGFSGKRTAYFEDQIAVSGVGGAFSAPGDSGSLVVDAQTRRPVGLLFAGGTSGTIDTTFINPIRLVLDRFQAKVL